MGRWNAMCIIQLYTGILLVIAYADAKFYSNKMRTMMVEQAVDNNCSVFTHKRDLLALSHLDHKALPKKSFDEKVTNCYKTLHKNNAAISNFVFPGTKWCGVGNTASHVDDYGSHVDVDKCCQQHDFCPKFISPKKCQHNLCNNSSFVYFHCQCDDAFRQCLNKINTLTSDTIASLYFTTLKMQCFEEPPDKPTCVMSDINTPCELQIRGNP